MKFPVKIEIWMHPVLKAMLICGGGLLLGIIGILLNSEFLLLVGIIASGGGLIAYWLLRSLMDGGCDGEMQWRGDDELEVYVGTCSECDRWSIRVRGHNVATGRGYDAFHDAAEAVARTYEGHVPAIANRFRMLIADIEEDEPEDTPPPEEGFATERET